MSCWDKEIVHSAWDHKAIRLLSQPNLLLTLDLAPRFKLFFVQSGFRIGEAAQRAGVSVDTIRYYERVKLLPPAPRSDGGYRLFAADTIEQVRFIKQAQDLGFSLVEIRMLMSGGGADKCRQTRDLLRSKLEVTNQRIKALSEFKRRLSRHLQACEDELARRGDASRCPVIVEIGQAAQRKVKR